MLLNLVIFYDSFSSRYKNVNYEKQYNFKTRKTFK